MPNGHAESPSSERSLDLSRMHAFASMCLAEGGSPNMTKSQVSTEREQGNLPRLNSLEWEKQVSAVKGRLRKAIQDKRAMNGKDALCLDFILDSPMEDKSLAPEELVHIQRRAHIRKERNRLAAQRMRERRKSYCDKLVKELEVLEDSNSQLVWEIRNLEIEKNKLTAVLKTHLKSCDKARQITVPKKTESVVEPMQPLDLRTTHSQSPKPEVQHLQLYQAPAPPEVREQDAPLDLRVLKRHCSVLDSAESSQPRRPRLSSV